MDLTEDEVRTALHKLQDLELIAPARDSGRAPRYEHRIRTVLNLRRDETAVLCLLLLRGPQTPGELRSRSDRMHSFDELAAVQSTLDRLAARDEPLVAVLPRAPGSREARWTHLLGDSAMPQPAAQPNTPSRSRQFLSADPSRPFSDAVLVDGRTLYLSGRLGVLPGTTTVPESVEEEAHLAMQNIGAALALAGMSFDHVVQLQVFCPDVSLWERFNAVYRTYFNGPLPARAFLGSGPLLFGAHFELIGIAIKD
jgi:2-iminobutanoate/2-iminopropanoate deaminase